MIALDIDRILVGENTQIRVFTDHRNWIQSPAADQAPVFVAPSGLAIAGQEILDDHTALLTVNPSVVNSLCTLTDTMNHEAITLKCWDAAGFLGMGESPDTQDNDDESGKSEANNPIDDGYWNSDSTGNAGLGVI